MTAAGLLLAWYEKNKRDLPWRRGASPYGTLVSEIMLQQTQVDRVIPFYERWMKRFPDFLSLAGAPLEDVLVHWEGLGYYARARNLHSLATLVCERYGGKLPRNRRELMKLPGIGPYTSAAVMCIAFDEVEPAVDANAARVYARFEDVFEPPDTPGGRKRLEEAAKRLLVNGPPGEVTQAVMELGALICRARAPECRECPLVEDCQAYRKGNQSLRPVKEKGKTIVQTLAAAAVVFSQKGVLLYRRPPVGSWGGLWGFPAGEFSGDETAAQVAGRAAAALCGMEVIPCEDLGVVTHSYMNKRVTLHALRCRAREGQRPDGDMCHWVPLSSLDEFPLDAGSRKIAKALRALSR
ncbi:MAG: A/G-specific adenine glycosylase [Thermovirgaceae bacterium]